MLTFSQILAIAIFGGMLTAVIIGKMHRFIPALIGATFTFVVVFIVVEQNPDMLLRVLNLNQLVQYNFWVPGAHHIESRGINWQTIIFIAGMMAMVEGLGRVGFFRWLSLTLAKRVNYKAVPLLMVFMLLSGVLSMFIDSITVLLFLAAVTIELARVLKFDPVPMIVAEIFTANVGGSATMSGDPPNIIIGTALGYTFNDFLVNTGPIAWAGMGVTVTYFYFRFRKQLAASQLKGGGPTRYPQPREAISDMTQFRVQAGIFIMVVVLLVTHAISGISVALIGVIAALSTLATSGKAALMILRRVDWRTLLFFIGLFIVVGGLEETGLLRSFANYIGAASGGETGVAIPIILWGSAITSAIVDNIPFAAAMVPVIVNLSESTQLALPTLAWTLALGADIGGNATPIGASANVVGTAIAEREGHRITWKKFMKYCIPPTLIVVALTHGMLLLRYG